MNRQDEHECFMRQARDKLSNALRWHQYGCDQFAEAAVAEAANKVCAAIRVIERPATLRVAA
jgi:hypothetical protein